MNRLLAFGTVAVAAAAAAKKKGQSGSGKAEKNRPQNQQTEEENVVTVTGERIGERLSVLPGWAAGPAFSANLSASHGPRWLEGEEGSWVIWGEDWHGKDATLTLEIWRPADGANWTDFSWAGGRDVAPLAIRIWADELNATSQLCHQGGPLRFSMPVSVGPDWSCFAFRQGESGPSLTREDVWRAEGDGLQCLSNCLGIFVVAEGDELAPCTNLELLTPAALSAVFEREGWALSSAFLPQLIVLGMQLVFAVAGFVWERRNLRHGRTREDPGNQCVAHIKEARQEDKEACQDEVMINEVGNGWNFWGNVLRMRVFRKCTLFLRALRACRACLQCRLRFRLFYASEQLVTYFLSFHSGISIACIEENCWVARGPWQEASDSLPRTVLLFKMDLYASRLDATVEELCAPGPLQALRRLVITFLAAFPMLDFARLGAGPMTVAKRWIMEANRTFGTLATALLLINFNGDTRSWEAAAECPIQPNSELFIFVSVALSWLVSSVPRGLLRGLGDWSLGRPLVNLAFWLAAPYYLVCCFLILVLGNANADPISQRDILLALETQLILDAFLNTCRTLRFWLPHEILLFRLGQAQLRKKLRSAVCLQHFREKEIAAEEEAEAQRWAGRGMSAEELLRFHAMLGTRLMPSFSEGSTSEEVLQEALLPLVEDGPVLAEAVVEVEVTGVTALEAAAPLVCCVRQLSSPQGACLGEVVSGMQGSPWPFLARVRDLEQQQSLEIQLAWLGGQAIGTAQIAAAEIFCAEGGLWNGELVLVGAEACSEPPRVIVQARVPRGYLRTLAARTPAWLQGESATDQPFSEAGAYVQGRAPPDRVVLSGRQCSFQRLVALVLADATGEAVEAVEAMLAGRDFAGLLAAIRAAGGAGVHYWLDLFAAEPHVLREPGREALQRCMPAMLRSARELQYARAAGDLAAGRKLRAGPLEQLVAVTAGQAFLQDCFCVSDLVLGRAMGLEQRVVVHPDAMGKGMAHEVKSLAEKVLALGAEAPPEQGGLFLGRDDFEKFIAALSNVCLEEDGAKDAKEFPEKALKKALEKLNENEDLLSELFQQD